MRLKQRASRQSPMPRVVFEFSFRLVQILLKPGPHRTRQRCPGPACDRPGASRPVSSRQNRLQARLEQVLIPFRDFWFHLIPFRSVRDWGKFARVRKTASRQRILSCKLPSSILRDTASAVESESKPDSESVGVGSCYWSQSRSRSR